MTPEISEPGLLIINGRVTEMNPGSPPIKHARVSGVGSFGGDYADFLTDDTGDVGEDIGKLLLKF